MQDCERRYDELLRAVTDYTYTVTVENGAAVKTVHSEACVGVTGFASAEYDAQPYLWLDMIHPEDRDVVLRQTADILAGQDSSILEHRIRHKDGSIRWIQNTLLRRHDPNFKLIAYDGLIRDITQRKNDEAIISERTSELERINEELRLEIIERQEAEKALQESENKLKNIFNTSIPICITNTDYQIILSNEAYKNLHHLNEQCEYPVKCFDSRPGPTCMTDACPMIKIAGGEREVLCESTKINDDGSKQYFIVTARPFLDRKGRLIGMIECFQEITERKTAEIERDKLIEELQTALSEIKTLRGILPICSYCKNIRNDEGYYEQIEGYIHKHSGVDFSHTICPECYKKELQRIEAHKKKI